MDVWRPDQRTAKTIARLLLRASNSGYALAPRERSACVDFVFWGRRLPQHRVALGRLWILHGRKVLDRLDADAPFVLVEVARRAG